MISFCTLGSWVLMLASPTWPSSYLHVHKIEHTLFIFFFLIKRHRRHLHLNAPLSATPVPEGNQLRRLSRRNPRILYLVSILPTSIPSSPKKTIHGAQKQNWFESDTVPPQIEFPPQKNALDNNNRPCHLVNVCLKCGGTTRGHVVIVQHQNAPFETGK